MQCNKCKNEAVFFQSYSGRYLCSRHLALDIEARAKRAIRSHHWMSSEDHIAVMVSGNRKSAALLCFLKKLIADRRDIRLSVLSSVGDQPGMTVPSPILEIAESLRIPCIEMPRPGRPGTAAHDKVTKIATALSLDDIAQGVLKQFLFGDVKRLIYPPHEGGDRIPVIFPFMAVPSDELEIYGKIGCPGIDFLQAVSCGETIPQDIGTLLEDYSRHHPATKYALLHLAEQLCNLTITAPSLTGLDREGSGDRKSGMGRFFDGVTDRGA